MKLKRFVTVVGAMLFPLTVVLVSNGCSGCKDTEEELPPAPPPPEPTPTPAPIATIVPEEDAGPDVEDASDGDAKKVVGTGDPSGIRACCNALSQNAKSAPPEQQGAYLAAAGVCQGLIGNPQARALMGTVRAALRGAQMPAACQ